MKTQMLRNTISEMNLNGLVSLEFNRGFNSEEKNYHVHVGAQMLSFETSKEQNKVYNMLIGKFGFESWSSKNPRLSEEEEGYFMGWAADMANPKCHGNVHHSILSADGNGGVFVWDYYQQKVVKKDQLTKVNN